MSDESPAKRLSAFAVKEIWAPHGEGFARGMVEFAFADDRFAFENGIGPSGHVSVTAFISHDAAATFGTVERELLAEARALLSLALEASEERSPKEIGREAKGAMQAEDDRHREAWLAEFDRKFETPPK